jgi:hypothetical protein
MSKPDENEQLRAELREIKSNAKYRSHSDAAWMQKVDILRAELRAAVDALRDIADECEMYLKPGEKGTLIDDIRSKAHAIVVAYDAQHPEGK